VRSDPWYRNDVLVPALKLILALGLVTVPAFPFTTKFAIAVVDDIDIVCPAMLPVGNVTYNELNAPIVGSNINFSTLVVIEIVCPEVAALLYWKPFSTLAPLVVNVPPTDKFEETAAVINVTALPSCVS